MKKILFSLSVILSVAANAQTISQAANEPAPWDPSYTTLQCDSVSPGGSGAAQTWNYSTIGIHSSIPKTYAFSVNTNPVYSSAYVLASSGLNDNSYYKSNGNVLNYYGGNFTLASGGTTYNINLIYNVPSVKAIYPMSLSSTTTAIVSGSLSATGGILPLSGTFTGTSTVNANATGTLVLAGRTFTDIVRVVTTQTLNAAFTIGATAIVTQLNYDYISASAAKESIFTISTSTLSLGGISTQTIVTVLKDYLVVGINETKKQNIDLTVFPNPATSIINFNTTSLEAAKIIAYDLTGKIIATEFIEMGKAKMNINYLSNGLYLYTVIGKSNQTLATGKFNVSK